MIAESLALSCLLTLAYVLTLVYLTRTEKRDSREADRP